MKIIVAIILCLIGLPAFAQKISDLPEVLVLTNGHLFIVAKPGVANYKVTYGSLITNLQTDLELVTGGSATNAVIDGENLTTTNATTFGVFYDVLGQTNMRFFGLQQGSNIVMYRTGSNIVINSTGGGSTGGTTTSNANMVFVDKGGNDGTAKRGRRDLPYLTLPAAKAAAVAGDTVIVFPGTYYNCTNLLKPWVNWYGYGAWLTYTNVTNDAGVGVFDDRFSGAVTSSISGFSYRYSCGYETTNSIWEPAFGPTNVLGCFIQTNRVSEIDFRFGRIEFENVRLVQGAAAVALFDGTNSYVTGDSIMDTRLTSNKVIGYDPDVEADVTMSSVASGVYWKRGEHHVSIKRIESRWYSIYLDSPNTNDSGNFFFTGDYTLGKIYSASQTLNSDWKAWFTLKEARTCPTNTSAAGTINIIGTGKYYFSGLEKVSGEGTAVMSDDTTLLTTGDNVVWLDCQKMESTSKWIDATAGARVFANVQEFRDLGRVNGGIYIDGGFLELNGKTAVVTNTSGSVVSFISGSADISNIKLSALNSTNAPVLVTTNGLVLQNCKLLSKAGVFSIRAPAAQTMNLASCWMNRLFTNNITGLVGPWTIDANVR